MSKRRQKLTRAKVKETTVPAAFKKKNKRTTNKIKAASKRESTQGISKHDAAGHWLKKHQ